MKYLIVIPDGCADEPQESLDGKTPMQAAELPNMDRIAQRGVVGLANNVPKPLTPASDVATLSLFGYNPLEVYTGRAPLETAAMGIKLGPEDWAIRCNLVTIEEGRMASFTADHIGNEEGAVLLESLQQTLGGPGRPEAILKTKGSLEFHAGVSYRNVLVYRSDVPAPFSDQTKAQPPHDIADQPIAEHLPSGPGSELLRDLMSLSEPLMADHPVNRTRIDNGKKPATQIWLWGQGKAPSLQKYVDVYGRRGAIISAVDLVRGVGILLGWQRVDVEGATGYLDTDYAAKGRKALEILPDYDVVCVHVEAPDEASHEGRADAKVEALQAIDRDIVGPVVEALNQQGEDYRILVSPDHRTYLRTKGHAYGAVPFTIAGTGIEPSGAESYDEVSAAESGLAFEKGYELMTYFLGESRP